MGRWRRNWERTPQLRSRLMILRLLLALPLLLAAVRLVQLQVLDHLQLRSRGASQSVRRYRLPALRGTIVDRQGKALVRNAPLFQLWANRALRRNHGETALLARLYGAPPEKVLRRFVTNRRRAIGNRVLIDDNLPYDTAVKLMARLAYFPDLMLETTFQRLYADDKSLGHILGYIGEVSERELARDPERFDVGDRIGKSGVEKHFDELLFGKNGLAVDRVDAHGNYIETVARQEPKKGRTLHLSIDFELQQFAAGLLRGHTAALAAIDPQTGQLIAAVSNPGIALNDFRYRIDTDVWKSLTSNSEKPLLNRVIQGQYPPGSTYKPVVAFAALAEGLITPEEKIGCTGSYRVGRRKFRCWKSRGHGQVNLHKALRESCDSYFYELGMRLGPDKIAKYARLFGLGQKTGIELANEKSGLVPTRAFKEKRYGIPWQDGETPSIAIGQGFDLLTPLQLARMYAIIANGGHPLQVTLLADKTYSQDPIPGADTFLPLIRSGLEAVVNEPHGTGYWARLRNIKVAGKTGTAQVISQSEPVTDMSTLTRKHRDHAWFVGYAPAEKAELVVALIVEHAGHGGSVAAPIVRKVLQHYLEKKRQNDATGRLP